MLINKNESLNEEKYGEYSVIKKLYKTKNGELLLVSKNDNAHKLFTLNKIEIKNEKIKNDIESELNALKQVDSKYIIKINEYFIEKKEEKSFFCLILDYYENNLSKLIYESNFINSKITWKFFIQIIIQLDNLNLNKLLPNYLFPENIYIDEENNIKIGGIGITLDISNKNRSEMDILSYCSPEIIKGEENYEKNIIWSAGCILYELAFKKRAFMDKNYKTLEHSILQIKYELPDDSEKELILIINKLLSEKKKRPSIKELILDGNFKNKIIEINLFSQILNTNLKGK